MEFLTIFLSGLLAAISPAGLIVDNVAENAISSQLAEAEQLEVRIDNAPSYQIVQGKIEKVRFAGRGLYLIPEARIDTLELETDPIDINLEGLRQGGEETFRQFLRQPLQGGLRIVLTQEDLNQALQSPEVMALLEKLAKSLAKASNIPELSPQSYQFVNPQIDLLGDNRLRFQIQLRDSNPEQAQVQQLHLMVESKLTISDGHSIELRDLIVAVDGAIYPAKLVEGFAVGLSKFLDLKKFEQSGITARLLKLEIDSNTLQVAGFISLEPIPVSNLR